MRILLGLMAAALAGGAALAAPVDGKTAKAMLYPANAAEVVVVDTTGLTEADVAIIRKLDAFVKYYAAVALVPGQSLMKNEGAVAANYHDAASARSAALKQCNATPAAKGVPCLIVAEVRPKGWQPRAVQLNVDATVGFRKEYSRARAPKALAISPSTAQWAVAKGDNATVAAIEACTNAAGAADCLVVIAE